MRSQAQCFGGVTAILCLSILAGCGFAKEAFTSTSDKEFKSQALDLHQVPAVQKKSLVAAKRMDEWECKMPKAQVGEYPSPVENAKQWTKLWTRWQPDKPVPDVDFDSLLVYPKIRDAGDGNRWGVVFYRETDGKITEEATSTAMYCEPTDQAAIHFYVVPTN